MTDEISYFEVPLMVCDNGALHCMVGSHFPEETSGPNRRLPEHLHVFAGRGGEASRYIGLLFRPGLTHEVGAVTYLELDGGSRTYFPGVGSMTGMGGTSMPGGDSPRCQSRSRYSVWATRFRRWSCAWRMFTPPAESPMR